MLRFAHSDGMQPEWGRWVTWCMCLSWLKWLSDEDTGWKAGAVLELAILRGPDVWEEPWEMHEG